MVLYAVENLDDALDATREFLLPFDAGRWLRLALVALFVAGSTTIPGVPVQSTMPGGGPSPGPGPGGDVPGGIADAVQSNLGILLGVAAVLVLLGVALALVSSVMEFVFVESLRSGEVRVRQYFGRHLGKGLRLFGFRLALGLVGLLAVLATVALAFGPLFLGAGALSVVAVLVFVPLLILVGLLFAVVSGFTTFLVVPVMLAEDLGVLAAWRRLWPTLVGQWKQYAVLAVFGFVLALVAGFVAGLAMLLPTILLVVVFGAVFAAALILGGGLVGAALAAVVGVLFLLALLAAFAVVQVPIQSYLRLYALFVLGDVDADLDLVPSLRAAVRESRDAGPTGG